MVNTLRHTWGDGASDHDAASNTFTPTEIDSQVDRAHEERTISIQNTHTRARTYSNRTMEGACRQGGRQAGIYRIHIGRHSLTQTQRERERDTIDRYL